MTTALATALATARAEVERLEAEERAEAERRAEPGRAEALARLEERVAALRGHWAEPLRYPVPEAYVARTWELHGLAADALEELGGVADLADGTKVTLTDHPRGVQFWHPGGQWNRTGGESRRYEDRARELAARKARAG